MVAWFVQAQVAAVERLDEMAIDEQLAAPGDVKRLGGSSACSTGEGNDQQRANLARWFDWR
ncbi:MAG: hypothetical protein AB7U73_23645 [Pirellulales bacterium]